MMINNRREKAIDLPGAPALAISGTSGAMTPDPSQELVDVVDAEGRVVATVPRREVRARRLPHRGTYVLVFNRRGELFIHLRTPTKDVYPSYWDVTVGGVLGAGESFAEGVRREAREELGIDVEPEELFPFHYADGCAEVFGMVYRLVHEGPFRLQPEEIVRGEFVPPGDVAARAARDPFCPDGLAVWAEYQRRTSSEPTDRHPWA
jgi:isopentenyldiphosphate isomerase